MGNVVSCRERKYGDGHVVWYGVERDMRGDSRLGV